MSHFYERTKDGIRLLKSVTTPAQARKSEAYVSVTTVLKMLPNSFMDNWRVREAARLARQHPGEDADAIAERLWGVRDCPDTGDEISSSDFGTAVHKKMEQYANLALGKGGAWPQADGEGYGHFCRYMIETLLYAGIEPLAAEKIVWDDDLRVAGTIDLIAQQKGKVVLVDYKCRSCNGEGAKAYDKDCAQLAVEAVIVANDMGLDYVPQIYTGCICSDTGKAWLRTWTPPVAKRNLSAFLSCVIMYATVEMKLELGTVLERHAHFTQKSGL